MLPRLPGLFETIWVENLQDRDRALKILRDQSIRYNLLLHGCVRIEREGLELLQSAGIAIAIINYETLLSNSAEGKAMRHEHIRKVESHYNISIDPGPVNERWLIVVLGSICAVLAGYVVWTTLF